MSSQMGAVPAGRLNQIAQRKLEALGVETRLKGGGEALEGVLTFPSGRVLWPGAQTPILSAAFRAVGHDHLRFTEPPLAALVPVPFYDVLSPAALEQRVAARLEAHLQALRVLAQRLQALKLQIRFEPELLRLRAALTTGTHIFEMTADPVGVWVSRVLKERGGAPLELPREAAPLRLEEYDTAVDLEIFLTGQLPRLEAAARSPQAAGGQVPAAAPRATLEAVPPVAPGALLLGTLTEHFGPGAQLQPGPRVEVVQEFRLAGARYRFHAVQEAGTIFRGRLTGPTGDRWADRFDLTRFPGITRVVRGVLGVPEEAPPAPATPAAPPASPPPVPWHLAPQPGEVWVMSVLVEGDDGREVRYVCTDIDGKPYGATRLLPREDFRRLFVQDGGGWRLLIHIDAVSGTHVTYRQLNAQRQPLTSVKQLSTAVLVSTFVPEGA